MPRTAQELVNEYKALWDHADREGRDLTPSERREVEALVDNAQSQGRIERKLQSLNGDSWTRSAGGGNFGRGIGDVFIESPGYKSIADPASRASRFSSGLVEVSDLPLSAKGTLTETTGGGPGGGLVPPEYTQGVVEKLFWPLGVGDLFSQSATQASQIRYVVEGTATSGATGVAEGAAKPESTLGLSEVSEPIKKVATSLTVSDEMLEDAASIQSYLNSRLSLFVRMEEERQLLVGGGTNELAGLIGRAGVNTYARGTVDNNAVCLLKVIANTRGSSFLEPDSIVINPTNWLSTRLLTDTAGQFLGGGPFTGAYGNANQTSTSAFSTSPLWGLKVVTSTVIGAGTAIVGSFGAGAHIWRRGGLSIEASNSHGSYFLSDLVALRAESRLGLGVFRPSSFTVVSGLS